MRLLIIILVGLSFCTACTKDREPSEVFTELPNAWAGTQKNGWVKAERQGKEWKGSGGWSYISTDSSKMTLLFRTFYSDTILLESFSLVLLPLKEGKYELSTDFSANKRPSSLYWVGYYDEIDALYNIDGYRKSHVWIDAYDPVKQLIKGRFQVYFFRERSELFNYPKGISFENGEFEVSLLR